MIAARDQLGQANRSTMSALKAFLFFLTVAFTARSARAQPVFTLHRSVELRVAQAEFVVRGTIANLSRTVLCLPGGYVTNSMWSDGVERFYGTQMPDGIVSYTIAVKVDEVIKGPRRTTTEFVAHTSVRDDRFEHWAARRASFLCFGNASMPEALTNKPLAFLWNAISLGPPFAGEQTIKGMVDFPPVFSMDFACLDDPEEILARARQFAKRKGASAEVHVFENPPLPASRHELLWTRLAVPVVPSLEAIARRLIKSPEDFLRPTQDLTAQTEGERQSQANALEGRRDVLRAEGIAALRYFKSKKNIALLKPLLNDPASMIEHHRDDRSDVKRVYYIRKVGYETLGKWGVEVHKPLLEEPLPR